MSDVTVIFTCHLLLVTFIYHYHMSLSPFIVTCHLSLLLYKVLIDAFYGYFETFFSMTECITLAICRGAFAPKKAHLNLSMNLTTNKLDSARLRPESKGVRERRKEGRRTMILKLPLVSRSKI